ncbi:uncharacterized protein [Palaemon carinicauda]|uniref:uncharacterized protein n=1 Tax=Palaemon carinicauda TaxID=392227 RepID=UPI0035B5A9F6
MNNSFFLYKEDQPPKRHHFKRTRRRRGFDSIAFVFWFLRRQTMLSTFKVVLLSWALFYPSVSGHGYMTSPAARNSAWRFGFDTTPNYGDNELFCGGREKLHYSNGGRCGVCGDDWSLPQPRPHERGGQFGQGVITANYTEGQVVPVTIHLSANHKGWYEFRLCNNNNPQAEDSQRCLDKQLLQMADGSGSRYYLEGHVRGSHTVHVKLPDRLSCSHCLLQWTWVVGNTWGTCPDGSGANGCGPQETFVNCADVSIYPKRQGSQGPGPRRPIHPKFSLRKPHW